MAHVFISYSRKDQAYARRLAKAIRKRGFDVWIDDRIDYGERWWHEIENAIETCGAFVVVMTPDSKQSQWVLREILLTQRNEKPIFPILLKGQVFSILIDLQHVDVTDGSLPPVDFYRRLARILPRLRDTSGAWVTPKKVPSIQSIKQADSFIARHRTSLLWAGVFAVLVAVVSMVIFAFLSGGEDEDTPDERTPTEQIAEVSTDSPTPSLIPTDMPTSTFLPTLTITPSNTPTDTPTSTLPPTLTLTPSSTPTDTPTAGNRVTANSQWTPVIQEFNGVEMVKVPAGCFMMGSDDNELTQPAHQQCIKEPFWIDRYEVSNAQFAAFSGNAMLTSNWTAPDHPREQITWIEAHAFCTERRGMKLPTEIEWEYAARGPDGLIYPWGNELIMENAIYSDNSGGKTALVGSRPNGMSWVGAMDMSGNVWEWINSEFKEYPYSAGDGRESISGYTNKTPVIRSGSFDHSSYDLTTSSRLLMGVTTTLNSIGFRCARDAD